MLSDNQESCTSTNISPQPPLITAGDIFPGQFEIDMLPDEIFLEIFVFYVTYIEESQTGDARYMRKYAWRTLARVCRRWRNIACGSPRRLNLRIFCSGSLGIPLRKKLEFWPPFPIALLVGNYNKLAKDNILATLEYHDRVCDIDIWNMSSSLWKKVLPLMQKPFPVLTNLCLSHLGLSHVDDSALLSVVPADLFLGGSAPQLRTLSLAGIPFPGLPKLLLSTIHLTQLELHEIPYSGYIAPKAMVTCISRLTRLESLKIDLQAHEPRPEWGRSTPSSTCALLPSLTRFRFKGVSGYLEDIVGSIDAPLLNELEISFFHQPTGLFDTPRLTQFIDRVPKLKTCNEAKMCFGSYLASVKVSSGLKTITNPSLLLESYRGQPHFELPPLVHLCNSSFLQNFTPTVERLTIDGSYFIISPENDPQCSDPDLWWEILQPFTAVKDLYLRPQIGPCIALLMQRLVEESVIDPLPVLQNIVLEQRRPSKLVLEGIRQFVAARQLAGHPIHFSLG